MSERFRSGFVALVGRPNVGKSTLVNAMVGRKVSITSRRPQTTRHRILGVRTTPASQIVFVDTPGLQALHKGGLNAAMNRIAGASLEGVDVAVLMITANGWTTADEVPLRLVQNQSRPVFLVINKVDRLKSRERLLPLIDQSSAKGRFAEIVPVSAKTGDNIERLERLLTDYLPEAPPGFPREQLTDRSDRFMAAEFVREQLFRSLGQELPYACAVLIEEFARERKLLKVRAVVVVEKAGQKAIVIGKGGERLKEVGRCARLEMERYFEVKVYLDLWVKVRADWTESASSLRYLGYLEDA